MDEMMACSGCRYWQRGGPETGECRRHAPTQMMKPSSDLEPIAEVEDHFAIAVTFDQGLYFGWPETPSHAWCGDFEVRLP